MELEEKYNLAFQVIKKAGVEGNKETVLSIAECIKEDRYFYELSEGKLVVFLTWDNNVIEGKRHIFVHNCWIDPVYRKKNTLVRIRTALKFLMNDVYKWHWFNNKRQKMIDRR